VRTTPEGRGTTTSSPRLYPPGSTAVPSTVMALAAETGDDGPPGEGLAPAGDDSGGDGDEPAESRQSLRALRRRRRHVMVGCAVVIALCVLLTALIVGFARDRRTGTPVIAPTAASSARAIRPTPSAINTDHHADNPDATASEGAQP
jgi:hypothetical protein